MTKYREFMKAKSFVQNNKNKAFTNAFTAGQILDDLYQGYV